MIRQEPRPAYHRRNDLKRLQECASDLPVRISDTGHSYAVDDVSAIGIPERLFCGRYQVIHAYLSGWRDARRVMLDLP